jgi:hypothetical protein
MVVYRYKKDLEKASKECRYETKLHISSQVLYVHQQSSMPAGWWRMLHVAQQNRESLVLIYIFLKIV